MPVERQPRKPIFPLPEDFPCPEIPELDICSALLPGGFDFQAPDLLSAIQPALAPLVPLFNIVEAIVAVKACIEAATEMPDPSALIQCIPGLTAALNKILALLPHVSVPKMLVDLIDCIIGELEKLRRFVLGLLAEFVRIAALLETAAELEDPNINAIAICASERLAGNLDDRLKALIVLGRLLGFLRGMLDLIGIGDSLVPDWNEIAGSALEEIQAPLDSAVEKLTQLRELIPAD